MSHVNQFIVLFSQALQLDNQNLGMAYGDSALVSRKKMPGLEASTGSPMRLEVDGLGGWQ